MTGPSDCAGCPLRAEGEGFIRPSLSAPALSTGVLLLGKQPEIEDITSGVLYSGRAGFMLTRLLRFAGYTREQFDIAALTQCQTSTSTFNPANHCRDTHWGALLKHARVIVPMGQEAHMALGATRPVLESRGYTRPGPFTSHIIPTISPEFIMHGQAKYAAAFINDVQKAVTLAREGLPMVLEDYTLDPLPSEALKWAEEYRQALRADHTTSLAYDIETPDVGDDEDERDEDRSYHILRISFAYRAHHALSVPWTGPYMAAIRLLLQSPGIKLDWNGSFDRPRVRASGMDLNGPLHDAMVAWHVLHSDLPKRLGFATTFLCPSQSEWKHLSHHRPAYYNAVDSDVTWRNMAAIKAAMQVRPGLWQAYVNDVVRLAPALHHMEHKGMLIDPDIRYDRACRLQRERVVVDGDLEKMVPRDARRVSPAQGFVRTPDQTDGMVKIELLHPVKRCDRCDVVNPLKPHFRHLKKKVNPCDGAGVKVEEEVIERYANLVPWKPSREALIRYQVVLKRIVPHRFDRKTKTQKPSMDRKALNICIRRYPDDPFYLTVLKRRELSKLAGTYIGYPLTDEDQS